MESQNRYGKFNEQEEHNFRRKSRRRCLIFTFSTIILVALIVGIVFGVAHHANKNKSDSVPASKMDPISSLRAVCNVTEHHGSCYASISSLKVSSNATDPQNLFKLSLQIAMEELGKLSDYPEQLISATNDTLLKAAIEDCDYFFDDAIEYLNNSISLLQKGDILLLESQEIEDLKTWLSTTITIQETCLDGLREYNHTLANDVKNYMKNATDFASNSLAIATKILGPASKFNIPGHRKLLSDQGGSGFPKWVSVNDRRLLLQDVLPRPNITVAKDGTGDVKTVMEAVQKIPLMNSWTRFVIHVKEGLYFENVILNNSMMNVMMYGDGMYKTIISYNLSFIGGTTTFRSATFAVVGKGFIARDMGFKNSAGPAKQQAVAVRSGADLSVFYRCSFDAFQDTLYAHSNRQFYRDCHIIGTVDFIFGNAAVVIQNCIILPRQPMQSQFNTITAQGKTDRNQNTGISIQRCLVSPLDNVTAPTYLGRPWKNYSTTVVMQSSIGSLVNPAGWVEWVTGVEPPSTIYYGEYKNTGPGAILGGRVKWKGYRPNITYAEATWFTVSKFIQGAYWLPETKVAFNLTLWT